MVTSGSLRPARRAATRGFTLLELMIVITIIGILATIAMPRLIDMPRRAAEVALRQNLRTMRDCIYQYYGDRGHYPPSLDELVKTGYLRSIPIDPITKSSETWVAVFEDAGEATAVDKPTEGDQPDDQQPGVIDVKSGSPLESLKGDPYNTW